MGHIELHRGHRWQLGGKRRRLRIDDVLIGRPARTSRAARQHPGRSAFRLSDLAGHVVVINIWGSWCGPCRAATPDLVRLARQREDRGVRFVGIGTRDNLAAAKAFVANDDVPYPSVFDEDGCALLPFNHLIQARPYRALSCWRTCCRD